MWPQWLYLKKNERPWSGTTICHVFYPSLIDATWKILYCQYQPSIGPEFFTKGTLTAQGTLLHLSCERQRTMVFREFSTESQMTMTVSTKSLCLKQDLKLSPRVIIINAPSPVSLNQLSLVWFCSKPPSRLFPCFQTKNFLSDCIGATPRMGLLPIMC